MNRNPPDLVYLSRIRTHAMNQYFTALINQRTSRRTFRPGKLPGHLTEAVSQLLAAHGTGPLGTLIPFRLIDRQDLDNQQLKLGTYGFIQGARYFIAGFVAPASTAFLDYGYCLERIILELTGLGLGTCWLGGTFDRGEFSKAMRLPENQTIPAVTPVGYPTSLRGLGDRIIRLSAGSANRLSWKNLFFEHDTGHPLDPAHSAAHHDQLEAVRLAPSASNKQPWRIFLDQGQYHFSLCRTPGYRNKFLATDLQMVDIGIAMCHWDLAGSEKGLPTRWSVSKPAGFPDEPEYIITANTD
ncbi:MAG TPA: nitroreductase [Bacteroidales bacterium]|nr:nitroreductase [Bacteroidales bacterium]